MDADPCFARVVRGFEAVNRLHQSQVEDDSSTHDVMEHPVLIQQMRIRHDGKRITAEYTSRDDKRTRLPEISTVDMERNMERQHLNKNTML